MEEKKKNRFLCPSNTGGRFGVFCATGQAKTILQIGRRFFFYFLSLK